MLGIIFINNEQEGIKTIMRKSKLALLALVPLTLLLAACEEEASEVNQGVHFSEKTTQTTETKPEEKVETKEIKLNHNINFKGQTIPIQTTVAINPNRVNNWIYTVPTTVELGVKPINDLSNLEINVLNAYADVSLSSKYAKYNGLRQDSMNMDYAKTNNAQGIAIDKDMPFSIPFEIESVDNAEQFIHGWNGYISSDYEYVTEREIKRASNGVNLNIVWTLGIKDQSGRMYATNVKDTIFFESKVPKE